MLSCSKRRVVFAMTFLETILQTVGNKKDLCSSMSFKVSVLTQFIYIHAAGVSCRVAAVKHLPILVFNVDIPRSLG